jgi:beta-xylosidase
MRFLLLNLALWVVAGAFQPAAAGNPLFAAADPHATIHGRRIWIHATGGGRGGEFFAWSSADFRDWRIDGPVLRLADVPWVADDGAPRHHAWAPALAGHDGRFFFYYSVGPQNPTPSRIGVAVGDSPAGPFRDSGKPLLTGGNGFEAIDPMVFRDPRSGRWFFYAGGSAGARLRVFELRADMVAFAREIEVATPRHFTEGAFVHFHDGRYYLSYSHGNFRDASYSVHYATSASPGGPWEYRGPILASDDRHKGPGHHSILFLPGRSQWLIVYHRWNHREGPGPYSGARETCIDRLEHAPDGSILPVEMTDEGYDPRRRG